MSFNVEYLGQGHVKVKQIEQKGYTVMYIKLKIINFAIIEILQKRTCDVSLGNKIAYMSEHAAYTNN